MFEIQKQTSLERIAESGEGKDIGELLDYKVEQAKEKNLPIEQTVADYIGMSFENIDDKIKQLQSYKTDITNAINQLKTNKELAKKDVYKWMENNGIDKLKGVSISSITLKKEDVSVTKKLVIDIYEQELIELNYAHYEENIKPIEASIKINKKRKR